VPFNTLQSTAMASFKLSKALRCFFTLSEVLRQCLITLSKALQWRLYALSEALRRCFSHFVCTAKVFPS
jgi:predicted transcriptional regulator